MKYRRPSVLLIVLLGIAVLSDVLAVSSSGDVWVEGWSYRRSHLIENATGAGLDYAVTVDVAYADIPNYIRHAELVSVLPIPEGKVIRSGQTGSCWDGTTLHVWFGCQTVPPAPNDIGDDVYYTNSSDLVNWSAPVRVIDRSDEGIRDVYCIAENDYLYFFCQCFDGELFRPIRIYKILRTANFGMLENYNYVGVAIDRGAPADYDYLWVASPAITRIGTMYWMAYEARSNDGVFSIGRACATNIEGPWIKAGQLRNSENSVITNPYGSNLDMSPSNFADSDSLFACVMRPDITFYTPLLTGDWVNNNMTLHSESIHPPDEYDSYANFGSVGIVNGLYYVFVNTWDSGDSSSTIRLYRQSQSLDIVYLDEKCKTDFGDIRFTAADGVTQLDYWLENKIDSDHAIFHVKIADDLSSDRTIYIYYGKADATTTSEGANTFPFFDDFNRASSETVGNGWTEDESGSGKTTISNSALIITQAQNFYCHIEKPAPNLTNFVLQGKLQIGSNAGYAWYPSIAAYWNVDNWVQLGQRESSNYYFQWNDASTGHDFTGSTASISAWYYYRMRLASTIVYFDISSDDTTWTTISSISRPAGWANSPALVIIGKGYSDNPSYPNADLDNNYSSSGNTGTHYADDVFVRKYVSPEPAHGIWGEEETASTPSPAPIFVDGFESGNVNAWTTEFESNGAVNVQSGIKHHGTYAVQHSLNSVALAYAAVYKDLGSSYTTIYMRGYYRVSALPASGKWLSIGNYPTNDDFTQLNNLHIQNNSGTQRWWLLYVTNGYVTHDVYSNTPAISADTWYCIESYVKTGNGNGEVKVWIDGNIVFNVTGLTNNDFSITNALIDFQSSGALAVSEYSDCIVVAVSDAYIGPEQTEPVPTSALIAR